MDKGFGKTLDKALTDACCREIARVLQPLEPHVFDGTEALEDIVTLVTSASRPPNRTAIGKILKRKYAGAVHLDASSIFSVPTLEAFRATRRPPERHSGHK